MFFFVVRTLQHMRLNNHHCDNVLYNSTALRTLNNILMCVYMYIPLLYMRFSNDIRLRCVCVCAVLGLLARVMCSCWGFFLNVWLKLMLPLCRSLCFVWLLVYYCCCWYFFLIFKASSSSSRYLHLSKSCAYNYKICDSSGTKSCFFFSLRSVINSFLIIF